MPITEGVKPVIGKSVVDMVLPSNVPMEKVDPASRKPIFENVIICILLSGAVPKLPSTSEVVNRYRENLEDSVEIQRDLAADFAGRIRVQGETEYNMERYGYADANIRFRNAMLDMMNRRAVIDRLQGHTDLQNLSTTLIAQAGVLLFDEDNRNERGYENALIELKKLVDFEFE